MIFLNLFLGLYVIPGIITYLLFRWNYKVYEPEKEPQQSDLKYIVTPITNIFWSVVGTGFLIWFYLGFDEKSKGKIDMRKFFKL
jgi:hypothetical protein